MSVLLNIFQQSVHLSYDVTDKKENLPDESRNCMLKTKIESAGLAIPIQKHTDNIQWISTPGEYAMCDGLISNLNNKVFISLCVADCVPVCLFDPETDNFGLVHSGWRGTVKQIAVNAIDVMCQNMSKEKDIRVYMGTSISQKNYEVDGDVANLFSKKNYIKKNNKFLLDIKNQIRDDLRQRGLKSENINVSSKCTFEDRALASYRRDGEAAGRIIYLLGKKSDG